MKTERLIVMANQIGDFYAAFPDQAESKKEIAQHLKKFWAKSMCDQMIAAINDGSAIELKPIVNDAIKEHLA